MVPLEHVIGLSAILFLIGTIGALTRRNLIVILMSIELMLNAANLAFVGESDMKPEKALFTFSILYLFVLFAALVGDASYRQWTL